MKLVCFKIPEYKRQPGVPVSQVPAFESIKRQTIDAQNEISTACCAYSVGHIGPWVFQRQLEAQGLTEMWEKAELCLASQYLPVDAFEINFFRP